MCKNTVQPERPQMTRWRIACWILKGYRYTFKIGNSTDFPLQQWLHERASVLQVCTLPVLFTIWKVRDLVALLSNGILNIARWDFLFLFLLENCLMKRCLSDENIQQCDILSNKGKGYAYCVLVLNTLPSLRSQWSLNWPRHLSAIYRTR
jgi:hypothetical protein